MKGPPAKRALIDMIDEADLIMSVGLVKEADQLLESLQDSMASNCRLIDHREYHRARTQTKAALG